MFTGVYANGGDLFRISLKTGSYYNRKDLVWTRRMNAHWADVAMAVSLLTAHSVRLALPTPGD